MTSHPTSPISTASTHGLPPLGSSPAPDHGSCCHSGCTISTCHLSHTDSPPADTFLQSIGNFIPGVIYQFIADRQTQPAQFTDPRFTYLSDKLRDVYGLEPDRVIADWRVIHACLVPEDALKLTTILHQAIQAGSSFNLEYRIFTPTGEIKWIQAQAEPIAACPHQVIFNGILLDITARKLAEHELQQTKLDLEARVLARTQDLQASEFRLQEIIRAVPGVIYQFVYQHGETAMTYMSDHIYEITGHTAQQVQQDVNAADDLIYPDDQAAYYASIAAAIANPTIWQHEWRIVNTQGEIRWLRGNAVPTVLGDEHIVFNGVLLDITDHKLAEAALAESEMKFRGIIENASECFYIADQTGEITYLSPQFTKLLGYSTADWLHHTFVPLIHPGDLLNWVESLQNVALHGRQQSVEYRIRHQDGSWRQQIAMASPLRSPMGEIIGCVGVGRDVTEQKKAEQALQERTQKLESALQRLQQTQAHLVQSEKMSSLGQLVAGITHEINNPNNFIAGNLAYLDRYMQDLVELSTLYQAEYPDANPAVQQKIQQVDLAFLVEDLPRVINSMTIGTERIQKIIASLQHFSCLDESEFKAADLHAGIDNTLVILEHRLKPNFHRPAIQVIREYSDLPWVTCYAGALNQVFINIINNAIEALESLYPEPSESYQDLTMMNVAPALVPHSAPHCHRFTPTIWIQTARSSDDTVIIRIHNNGPNIAETAREKLFDPFFTTKPIGKGTGMGLAISYQIITEQHQGQLNCYCGAETGVEFRITLPLDLA
jgi:two-component system, NtrC family, sensor kinase